ncbi:hypothetical protein E2C01_102064 [Portunus trituberculatus]|uniref:Uncharacterized protein n=1 Tax=Portunus trituberculatus TaxID=210409 RepID=A0A5B7KGD4_PORTR|nr:hypothetical protein [Portunus trituberculatus]
MGVETSFMPPGILPKKLALFLKETSRNIAS